MTRITLGWLILSTLAAVIVTGCSENKPADKPPVVHGEQFPDPEPPSAESKFFDLQVANGARQDATLRTIDFDGPCLSTLGVAKLDQMLMSSDSCDQLHVYLDLPKDDQQAAERKTAVMEFLKDRGLPEEEIALASGPNLKFGFPAAVPVKALDAMDASAGTFSTSDVTGGPGGGSGGGGGGSSGGH